MTAKEKQLKTYLKYSYDSSEVFIRTDAILWFKKRFCEYWQGLDQKENHNYFRVVTQLYINDEKKSLEEIAKDVGLHIRTLGRYRKKFVAKMEELIEEYQYLNIQKQVVFVT